MSEVKSPNLFVGNEFVQRVQRQPRPAPAETLAPISQPVLLPAAAAGGFDLPLRRLDFTPSAKFARRAHPLWRRPWEWMHRYSLAAFALLFLLVGSSGTIVAARDWSAHLTAAENTKLVIPAIAGQTTSVPSYELSDQLQSLANQPASLTIGDQKLALSYNTIKSWLNITADNGKTMYQLSVNRAAIIRSLQALAAESSLKPVDQITDSSGTVISDGVDGTTTADAAGLLRQATAVTKNLLAAKGFQVNLPLKTVPYQTVAVSSFTNLIEVNAAANTLTAYQRGQLVNTLAVTNTGTTVTPTPLGQFTISKKIASRTVGGFAPYSKHYYHTAVQSISYFDSADDAISANDWQPANAPASVNTMHGSIGLAATDAQWLYNWAPTGTTVIIHN